MLADWSSSGWRMLAEPFTNDGVCCRDASARLVC